MEISIWEIKPSIPLIIDDSLKIANSILTLTNKQVAVIFLDNLKGFDLNSNPFENIKTFGFSFLDSFFYVQSSKFNFYSNGILIDSTNCN